MSNNPGFNVLSLTYIIAIKLFTKLYVNDIVHLKIKKSQFPET